MNGKIRKRVLILDISASGHHPTYLRWLLESDLTNLANVVVASRTEMFDHSDIATHTPRFTQYTLPTDRVFDRDLMDFSSIGLLKSSWKISTIYRRALQDVSAIKPVDFIIVPFIDDCIIALAARTEAFDGVPWMGITMRTMFHYRQMGIVAPQPRFSAFRRLLFYRILKQKSLVSILTIDPTLALFAKSISQPWGRKIGHLPDPAKHYRDLPQKSTVREHLGIPFDARVVLLYGDISIRKGILSLLDATANPDSPSNVHVLMAGRCREQEIISRAQSFITLTSQQRLHTIDGYLDDAQERQILAAADCMWIGYIDFYGMSGVLVLAARHSMPVLASNEGIIGYLARQYEIGLIVDPRNQSSIIAALDRLVKEPDFFVRAGMKGASFFAKHEPAELQRLVVESAKKGWGE